MIRRLFANTLNPAAFEVQPETQPSNDESWASLAVFTQLTLLAISFIVGHFLERRKVSWLGEAGFALLLGVGVGSGVKFFAVSETFAKWISFKKEFFFIALLPPIIFDAGFSLKPKPFFSNLGAICAYAFAGTLVSTFVVGYIVWLAGWAGICSPLTFLEATLFGAIVSATDPVTVLAIFQRLHVDEDLYALVFGESVLNDAVAIVMYSTLTIFLDKPASMGACVSAIGTFLAIFLGSMVVGIAFALLASWMVKSKQFRSDHMPLESCLVVLCAYASYMLADGLELSGIVSILFCGMVMAQYTRPNLSKLSRDRTAAFSKMLATMAETFVFIYVGVSLFLEDQAWDKGLTWAFLGVALVALAVSRALNIYPVTAAANALRPPEGHIPNSHSFMLWFSGLRGAMAFALSLQAAADLPDSAGRVILTSTFFIVLITVLINGGSSTYLIEKLGLRQQTYQQLPCEEQDLLEHGAGGGGVGAGGGGSPGASSVLCGDIGGHEGGGSGDEASGGGGGRGSAYATPGGAGVANGGGHSNGGQHVNGGVGQVGPGPRRTPNSGGLGGGGGSGGGSGAWGGGFLGRVRELNREGFLMDKLHRLDQRYLSKLFMPTQAQVSEEATEAEMALMSHSQSQRSLGGASCVASTPGSRVTTRPSTRSSSPARQRQPSSGGSPRDQGPGLGPIGMAPPGNRRP